MFSYQFTTLSNHLLPADNITRDNGIDNLLIVLLYFIFTHKFLFIFIWFPLKWSKFFPILSESNFNKALVLQSLLLQHHFSFLWLNDHWPFECSHQLLNWSKDTTQFFFYQNMGTAYHVAVKFLCKCLWVCYTQLVRECQISTTAMTFWIEDIHVSRLSRALIWITRAASTYLQLFWLWPSAVHSVKTWGILPLWGNTCPRNEQYTLNQLVKLKEKAQQAPGLNRILSALSAGIKTRDTISAFFLFLFFVL